MSAIGRKCSIVNLDPANDLMRYKPMIDVRDFIKLEDIMLEDNLGPNGGVLYALEDLEHNVEWLENRLNELGEDYVLFDCPGQMDLPHLNVLTKIDKLSSFPQLPFNLDFYTEVQDLSYLLPHLKEESSMMGGSKFESLNAAIVELVDGFGLIGFETLAVESKKSMIHLLQVIDRAGGYAFGGAEGANDTVWQVAMREGMTVMDIKDVQERWLDAKEDYDTYEKQELIKQSEAKIDSTEMRNDEEVENNDDDEDDEDLEAISRYMSSKDSGIKIIKKYQN